MSRPPKTTAEHRRDGTYQPCRHAGRADSLGSGVPPERPEDLDDDAGWLWDQVVNGPLQKAMDPMDGAALRGLARWWSLYRRLDRKLVEVGGDDYRVLAMATMAWKQFEKTGAKFGLTPGDRAALKLPDAGPEQAGKERHFKLVS